MGRLFANSSYIDISTNFAHLDSLDFGNDFSSFLEGDFAVRHLLTLVHETTHHWCLLTSVGTALAARACRTYHDAAFVWASIKTGRHDLAAAGAQRLEAGVLKSRILTAFLVPLLEGLAIYAEWRATPMAGGIYSRPFDILRTLTRRPKDTDAWREPLNRFAQEAQELSPDELEKYIEKWLKTSDAKKMDAGETFYTALELRILRSRAEERRRLEAVFSTSLDPRRGNYQLGYLFVCGLERICSAYKNTDMFLAFLRDFFLNDLELAGMLLDDETPFPEVYSKLRMKLNSKVRELVENPPATRLLLSNWAKNVPSAPAFKHKREHFAGIGSSVEKRKRNRGQRKLFEAAFSRFIGSVVPEVLPPRALEQFLKVGRVLMPLGSKDFNVVEIREKSFVLRSLDGQTMDIDGQEFDSIPSLNDTVKVGMLVNVASPALAVSLRWKDGFEAVTIGAETDLISREMIRSSYRDADHIALILNTGQSVLNDLRVATRDVVEPVGKGADILEESEEMALDIVQVYRTPILVPFTKNLPPILTTEWRDAALRAWQPDGVRSLLKTPERVKEFTRVSSMLLSIKLNIGRSSKKAVLTDNTTAALDELFEKLNSISQAEYKVIVERLDSVFAEQGVTLFTKDSDGTAASLV